MTNSELAARELQARIMGWEPTCEWDCIVDVPKAGPVAAWELMFAYLKANGLDRPEPNYTDGLDHSEY